MLSGCITVYILGINLRNAFDALDHKGALTIMVSPRHGGFGFVMKRQRKGLGLCRLMYQQIVAHHLGLSYPRSATNEFLQWFATVGAVLVALVAVLMASLISVA